MKIVVTVQRTVDMTAYERACRLFEDSGCANWESAKLTSLGNDRFEFIIPQAFTDQHPAVRYIRENA
jgi:hypothetical protein